MHINPHKPFCLCLLHFIFFFLFPVLDVCSAPPNPVSFCCHSISFAGVGAGGSHGTPAQAPLREPQPSLLWASLTREPARGRAAQCGRPAFRGPSGAGEALSSDFPEWTSQVRTQGGTEWWVPAVSGEPPPALLSRPSVSPQGQLWPGGCTLLPAQVTRAAQTHRGSLPSGAHTLTSPLRGGLYSSGHAGALHPS